VHFLRAANEIISTRPDAFERLVHLPELRHLALCNAEILVARARSVVTYEPVAQ